MEQEGAARVSATYDIRTIKDFLAVPVEKRESMLFDFLHWMMICDEVVAKFTPEELQIGDYFRWVDDGKYGIKEIIMRMVEVEE